MKQSLSLALIACSLLCMHCASTTKAVQIRERLALIKTWQVVYSCRIDPTLAPTYQSQRISRSGQAKRDLDFPEMILRTLKTKFDVPLARDISESSGQIDLNALEFASGGFKSVEVLLLDNHNGLLAKTRVWNDTQDNSFKFDDSFADYVAEKIADLIDNIKKSSL